MRIGNYELIEEVGHGSMGVVFKARQLSMDRIVALKVLPKRLARNEAFVARFIAEARAAGKLSHPNIVQVHDVGNEGETYFFSMEFVDGGTAFEIMQENGPFSEAEAGDIGRQIASGLDAAHSRGIVHRDVKPDNFMIDQKGAAKLADLGLARAGPGDEDEVGQAYGTPYYMSPEQARGQLADARSDLYSLGVSIYHMVAGKPPFEGATPAAVMAKHVSEEPQPLARVAGVSKDLAAVVHRLMRKDPAERPQSAREVVEALTKLRKASAAGALAGKSRASIHRRRPAPRRGGGAAQAAAGVIGAVVIAGGAFLFLSGRARRDAEPARRTADASETGTALHGEADRAQAEFNALSDWARRNPDSFEETAAKFEGFAKEFLSSPLGNEARKRAREARDEMAVRELVKRFDEVKVRASGFASRREFGNAVRELEDFGRSVRREDLAASARAEAAEVKRKAEAAFEGILRASKALEEKGDLTAARKELGKAQSFGLDELTARAERELSALSRRKEEAALAREEKVLDAALAKASALASERRFDDAAMEVETAARKLSGDGKERARMRAEDLRLAGKAWKGALSRLPSRRVPLVKIGLREQGSAVRADGRGVEVRKGRGSAMRQWKQFSPENVFRLIEQALGARDGMEHLGLAALAIELKEIEAADKHLRSAEAAGVAGDAYSRYRKLVDGKLAEAREASAMRLYERAKEATRLDQKAMARSLLTRYGDTEFVKKHRKEIEALALAKTTKEKKKDEPGRDATADLAKLGWKVEKGKWTVRGKGTFLGTEGPLMLQAGDDTWADEVVRIKAQLLKGEEYSVVVRYDATFVSQVEQLLQNMAAAGGGGRGGRGQFTAWRQALVGSLAPFPGYGVKVTGGTLQVFDSGKPPTGWRGAGAAWGQNLSRLPNMVAERKVVPGGGLDITVSVEGDKFQVYLGTQRVHADEREKRATGAVVIEAPEGVELLIQNPRVRKIR